MLGGTSVAYVWQQWGGEYIVDGSKQFGNIVSWSCFEPAGRFLHINLDTYKSYPASDSNSIVYFSFRYDGKRI